MRARRLFDGPIITADTPGADPLMRQNINGPCLLRDPCPFLDDDGRLYLLCTVRGEQGIALAELL